VSTISTLFSQETLADYILIVRAESNIVAQEFNPSTQEAETGESQVQGWVGLHSKTLSQTKQNKQTKKPNS
jgi:hypothetical protein